MTVSFEPLWRILDGLVHGSATGDALTALRHRSFIAAHLAAGLGALLVLTLWLTLSGAPSIHVAVAFLWLVAPLPIAAFLSRTGRYGEAHLLSAAALVGLVVWIGAFMGGVASPALVWLAVVPAEAALSGSRRITVAAGILAAAGLLGLVSAQAFGLLPPQTVAPPGFAPLMVGVAIVYAGLLALRIERIHTQSERGARDGEGRYRLLADNSTDLITRHGPNGDVEFASPAARSILGCVPAEILGHGLFNRVHVADRPAYLRALSEADHTGAAVAAEFRLRHGDNASLPRYVWLEMRCRPAIDGETARRSLVAVMRDVTMRKDQESAVAAAHSQAEQADRAKGRFLANMSHELRTPLNAIIGFSGMLEQELVGPFEQDRHREYARLIHASGEHLLEVVNGILDMSRIEAGRLELQLEPFTVASVVEASTGMMSHQISSRGLKLVCRIQPGMPELVADRRACRQILLNLLSNAVKFTGPGGTVTVSARMEGGVALLEVADDGIGISAEDLPRLGTPFVQADADYDRRYEGTGLGLSVVKGLAELHGGTMKIDSEIGRGTVVTVRIPMRSAASRPQRLSYEQRERKVA